jgi:Protein of unknown function (DUF1203)
MPGQSHRLQAGRRAAACQHEQADSPYRMRFAIFVRAGDETYDKIDEVPEQLRKRMLAVRALDRQGMMLAFKLADGRELEQPSTRCSPTLMPNICTCTSPRPPATLVERA